MTSSSLELAVLGLLKEGPMHGYELSKRLKTMIGPLYQVSYGSLYPCLKKLLSGGLVRESTGEPRRRRRRAAAEPTVTAKTTRRAKKVYEITAHGETFFFDQLEGGAVYDTDRFQARFAFFRYLPKESRIGLLERRKAYLQEKLIEFKESLQATRERIDNYARTLTEHAMEATEQDIKWLDGLIDKERSARGATPGGAAPRGGSG